MVFSSCFFFLPLAHFIICSEQRSSSVGKRLTTMLPNEHSDEQSSSLSLTLKRPDGIARQTALQASVCAFGSFQSPRNESSLCGRLSRRRICYFPVGIAFLFFFYLHLHAQDHADPPSTNHRPAAVPVLTPGEAEIANTEAFIEYENLVKSFHVKESDMNVLEGRIKSISICPDPQAIDYPDCNLTISVVLNDNANTEIVLIIPCIRGSKIVLSSSIKKML